MKLRAAERPHSLNIARNSFGVAGEGGMPVYSGTGACLPSQQGQTSSGLKPVPHAERLDCDILEQSLRAADVLADYPNNPLQPRSLSLACGAVSSIASSVAHPLGSAVDCALDCTQQLQRLNRRRPNNNNNNNNNNLVVHAGRHSLSDIVTPTSDVTTASSPSESLSQVANCISFSFSLCLSLP